MPIDKTQFRIEVIRPVLMTLNLYSKNAEELLMGTAAQESALGTYLRQIDGPALGVFMCQRESYDALWDKYIGRSRNNQIKALALLGTKDKPAFNQLIINLNLATMMARFYYWDILVALPDHNDIEAMGAYWKAYYNRNGKGTVNEFVENYNRYVK